MHAAEELSEFTETALTVRGMDVRVFESDLVTGPAFVLIHGFGVSSRYFGPLARELSKYGRVLVLDLPGFGKTHDPDHALRLPGFAHVVNEVIRTLDVVEPVLVGHSMGTQVAVEALLRAPGLSRAAVLAAPVVNDRERRAGLLMWRFVESAVKEPPASAWDSIRGFLHSGPRWLLRDFGPMLTYRIEDRVPDIAVPITVVGGVGDHIAPPDWCRRLAERCTNGNVVIVEGAAHQMIHTSASQVAEVALDLAKSGVQRPTKTGEGEQVRRSPGAKPPGLPPCGD
ncbi:alpha/beta fold hydrolase [Tessaracoccus antarcticus]|nr:alpha/beta hydrolase [Tessaracoccus antarcticus]